MATAMFCVNILLVFFFYSEILLVLDDLDGDELVCDLVDALVQLSVGPLG